MNSIRNVYGQMCINHKKRHQFKKVGIVKWKIDFIKKEASLYYNDELVGIPYTTFSNKIIPTISLCEGCEISCIHWETT